MSLPDAPQSNATRLNIPPRFYQVPLCALFVGGTIGLFRGSRTTSLRFLAENAHRPPRTKGGWYFYYKTKNYKVMLGGLKGAAKEGSRAVAISLGWIGIEEGMHRLGGVWDQGKEIGAGLGTAGVFSAVYRLPWKTAQQTFLMGLIMGSTLKALNIGRTQLEEKMNQKGALSDAESGGEDASPR